MHKRGTQSFFFHLPMVIFFLLAIILVGAIVFGIARDQGLVSYSPIPSNILSSEPVETSSPLLIDGQYVPFCSPTSSGAKHCVTGTSLAICMCDSIPDGPCYWTLPSPSGNHNEDPNRICSSGSYCRSTKDFPFAGCVTAA